MNLSNTFQAYFFLLLSFSMTIHNANALPALPNPFLSGEQLRDSILADKTSPFHEMISYEIGHYLQVPLDHRDPDSEKIAIYYFTDKAFDPKRPTLLFFPGGPGGSGHYNKIFHALFDWNVVFMDYRGIGLSFPASVEVLRTTRYFTSENVARDARLIAKELGADKVTVYGHSYGTVTANIFASLFPEMTRSVILEGVVFQGDEQLWSSSHRQKILQKFFNNLETEMQNEIIHLSNLPGANKAWFSRMGQQLMYQNNFEDNFLMRLTSLLGSSDAEKFESISADFDAGIINMDMLLFSANFFLHIACKELSALDKFASFNFAFEGRNLKPMDQPVIRNACAEMNIDSSLVKTYHATNYKISVPLFYVQGTMDGATTAPAGIWHYKYVPTGPAQLFLVKGAGHSPLNSELENKFNLNQELYMQLFRSMLNGIQIPKDQFKKTFSPVLKNWETTLK
jgi:proline iminopeptidase